ncbi:MAG: hypothetical protein JWP81_4187 [Ferruginibacter sp.]|nr:hypothetical protein [Ferruginibacter sp.]
MRLVIWYPLKIGYTFLKKCNLFLEGTFYLSAVRNEEFFEVKVHQLRHGGAF